jgi:histone H3/H4
MSTKEQTLVTYLNRIFSQAAPDYKWSVDAKQYMNDLVIRSAKAIIAEADNLVQGKNKKTIMVEDIELAFRLMIHGDASNRAVDFARRAVAQFDQTKPPKAPRRARGASPRAKSPARAQSPPRGGVRSPRVRKQEKAGILMSVSKLNRLIKEDSRLRVQEGVSVYLAAALQEICRLIFEAASRLTTANKRKTITADFIHQTLTTELACVF